MDPQQQQQIASMAAGFMGVFLLFGLAVTAFMVFLFWRIFVKAGFSGPLSLIVLVPGFGWLICLCILAFAQWTTPQTSASPYYPQSYPPPPPPAYPPAA